jgi:hypothetical protein
LDDASLDEKPVLFASRGGGVPDSLMKLRSHISLLQDSHFMMIFLSFGFVFPPQF